MSKKRNNSLFQQISQHTKVLMLAILFLFCAKPILKLYGQFFDIKYELCESLEEESSESEEEKEMDNAEEMDKLITAVLSKMSIEEGKMESVHHNLIPNFSEFEPGVVSPPPELTLS